MRSLAALTAVLALAGCASDPEPTPAPRGPEATTTAPERTLQEVADVLDCQGPTTGDAGYVGIACQGSAAQLTIAEWADMARGDIENINGSMVGDPDLWFMATDSITVSATDEAVIDDARRRLAGN